MTVSVFVIAWIAVVGACVGSFVNVVCHRLPIIRSYGEYADGKVLADLKQTYGKYTLFHPSSVCPCCKAKIPARFNVPILGWVFSRGKCAACGAAMSKTKPLFELLFAVAFAVSTHEGGLYPAGLMNMPIMTLTFILAMFRIKYNIVLKGVLLSVIVCFLVQGYLAYIGLSIYSQTQL